MAKKIVWQWESIDEFTSRVKIMGGWLVVHKSAGKKGNFCITSVIVNDTDWQWQPIEPYVDPQIEKVNIAKDYQA